MKNIIKPSVAAVALSLVMANQASAANTWAQARNDAMGGTGVASADYGSGALINPALLARSQPEDDITVILPALQAQITDKDNLEDEIDHISDRVDYYRDCSAAKFFAPKRIKLCTAATKRNTGIAHGANLNASQLISFK